MDEFVNYRIESATPLLAAFDAVATEGLLTRAAEVLDVPQSSVSRRVRALEKILGCALLQPAGRGVALTTSGRELYERTHHVIRELDDALAAVRADADPERGLVRFGFPLTLGPGSVGSLLAGFHDYAPRIRVHLAQAHGEALAEMIRDGRLDVAVVIPPPDDLDATVLGSQRLLLHVPSGHPFAGRSQIDIAELTDEPFVASPPRFQLRSLLDAWCGEEGFSPRVPFEINEIDTIRALVRAGLGVALLPIAETVDSGVVAVPLSGSRTREIALVTGRRRPTAATERFHTYVTEHLSFPD